MNLPTHQNKYPFKSSKTLPLGRGGVGGGRIWLQGHWQIPQKTGTSFSRFSVVPRPGRETGHLCQDEWSWQRLLLDTQPHPPTPLQLPPMVRHGHVCPSAAGSIGHSYPTSSHTAIHLSEHSLTRLPHAPTTAHPRPLGWTRAVLLGLWVGALRDCDLPWGLQICGGWATAGNVSSRWSPPSESSAHSIAVPFSQPSALPHRLLQLGDFSTLANPAHSGILPGCRLPQ